jgi:Flp pilus assembly CpaE family ATPase
MAGHKILVIDSDTASRNFIAAALHKEGHDILQASSGREGLVAAWRDRPEVIIADPVLADVQGEDLAERLRSDPRTAKMPLIALSSDAKMARSRSCIDAGFNEYLIKTGEAVPALIEAVNRLLGNSAAAVREGGLQIVFMSAKGGTGTSSLCANIGMNIATNQPEARVAVADMVLPIGSIAEIVAYQGSQNIVTISELPAVDTTPEFFRNSLTDMAAWRFHLLAGSPDPTHGNELKFGRVVDLVHTLRMAYDFILIDLGRSLSRISLPLIEHADLVVMIVSTDRSTIALTKTVWDYLQGKGLKAASIYTILNRAIGLEGMTKIEAEKIIGIDIKSALPYLGGNFSLANNQHVPFSTKFPTDTASIVLKDTARQMVDQARRLRAE